jgi:short-subunit dehydrogenase
VTTQLQKRDASKVALVTGACSGIGRALAFGLAERGYQLVVVSQRELELQRTADALSAEHGVVVHPLVMDLARATAAEELYTKVQSLGLEVDVLVNNAGFFFFGEAVDADPARANAMLQLHVVTPSLLCTRFGHDMRARGRGDILIVSSISAWRDFPGIGYYGSSKKYLRGFARSLRCELSVYGVNVTCLAPGATATDLYDPNQVPVQRARALGVMMTPEAVAADGLRALFAGEAELVPGLVNAVMAAASAWTPQWLVDLIRRRAPWLPKREGVV